MPDVKSPGRKFAEHGKFRIAGRKLRHLIELIQPDPGKIRVTTSRMPDFDVSQDHVFYQGSRQPDDGGRRDIPGLVFPWSLIIVTGIGFAGRHLSVNV